MPKNKKYSSESVNEYSSESVNEYSSESVNEYSSEYNTKKQDIYSSSKETLEDQTETKEISYDLSKPVRVKIKARIIND